MYIKTGPSTWKNTAAAYIKTGPTIWERIKSGYIKTGPALWKRFFFEANLPNQITGPTIRSANTSGTGGLYDGPVAGSPQFLNADLFGKDGSYSNYTSITGRKFSYADTLDATTRTTLVFDDRFSSAGGVTTANRTELDGKYLFYEITVNNGTGDDFINPVSSPKKMIKSDPVLTNMGWTGIEQVGTQLSLGYTIENNYYNKIDPVLSYVRWWRSSSANAGGTLIKQETITATSTGATSTSRTGISFYTPVADDIDYYIVAEITGRSSYTEHYGYTDDYMMGTFPTSGKIGTAIKIIDVNFTDQNGRSGKNARDNLVTATQTTLNWKVTGINSSTTYRVRYRVLNNQNGLYYNPFSAEQLAASQAWEVYEDNYYGTGNISSVSINGSTATLYDVFTINETFNGSTYGGGISRWVFEYELSVVPSSGIRQYWVYPESMSSSQTHDYWDIDPTTNPSISATPNPAGTGATVTFSGTFNSYPASLSSYPHSYRVVYGTSPATDSGWITLSAGTANQTYSNTKVYSDTGTYYPYIETTPSYTTNYVTLTVSNAKSPPTMGTPSISAVGTFVSGQRRLSVPFTAAAGSGPSYQIYWYPGADYSGAAKPPVTATIDGSGTTSPIIDETGPLGIGRYAVWIRSSATNTTTGTVAPSTTLSDWSSLANFYISGTRTLSYDDNTTDATASMPASTNGTDPWNGWVTTVSGNTPTRTGFTFNGWNTSSALNGTDYSSSSSITLTSDVTLWAKWTANTYAINYYGNGNTGGSVPDSQTKTYGVSITLRTNVNTLTKTGYTFGGWNTASDGSGTNYAAGASYTGNAALDLYAKWTENATAPGAPSNASIGTLTYAGSYISTLLNPWQKGNSTKVQTWTYDSTVTFPVSYTAGSGATSHEFYMSSSSTAPTSQSATHTSDPTAIQTNRGVITRYIWVRARNANGVSAWVSAGQKTSVATVVSGLTIKICRASTTTCTNGAPSSQNALSYTYTSVNTGFDHDAYVSATISGTALNAVY